MPIDERVLDLLSELAGIPAAEIRPDDELRIDLGLDSIRAMELLALLSDELGIELSVEEAADLTTVRTVLDLARSRQPDGP